MSVDLAGGLMGCAAGVSVWVPFSPDSQWHNVVVDADIFGFDHGIAGCTEDVGIVFEFDIALTILVFDDDGIFDNIFDNADVGNGASGGGSGHFV
jgi:hypothetical protein